MKSRNNNAGFTLIELLVALTIIAAILAMVYGSYAATTRSIDISGDRMACIERGCLALRLMARQLRCAYAPSPHAVPSDPRKTAADISSIASAAAPSEKSAGLFQGDPRDSRGRILSFVTTGGSGGGPNAPRGLASVTYRYDEAASTLFVCRRDRTDSLRDVQELSREQPLLRNVTSIALKFHDGRQWQDTWDFKRNRGLPRAVKVEIIVADQTGRPHHLGTTVSIVQRTNARDEIVRRAAAAW